MGDSKPDRFHAYMRGWGHGARAQAADNKFLLHGTLCTYYEAGYADGLKARGEAAKRASERFGYEPSPLRDYVPTLAPSRWHPATLCKADAAGEPQEQGVWFCTFEPVSIVLDGVPTRTCRVRHRSIEAARKHCAKLNGGRNDG